MEMSYHLSTICIPPFEDARNSDVLAESDRTRRGSGIQQAKAVLGTKAQKSKLKKAVAKRRGWGGRLCLSNVGKSLNK
eukprot:756469-Hanusia_phi.AAC.2